MYCTVRNTGIQDLYWTVNLLVKSKNGCSKSIKNGLANVKKYVTIKLTNM